MVLALKQRDAEALVTCDDNMLLVPRVVAVIEQTRFTVASCRAAGHDPVLATGILLAHYRASRSATVATSHRCGD